jgi:hypothetical protein
MLPVREWRNAQSSQRFPSLSLGAVPLQPVPIRSASFSSPQGPQSYFASAMRETRTFPSTFKDDESGALSDVFNYLSYNQRSSLRFRVMKVGYNISLYISYE